MRRAPVLVALALSGCVSHGVTLIRSGAPSEKLVAGSPALPTGGLDYRAGPLDTLQVDIFPAGVRADLIDYGSQVRVEAVFTGAAYAIAPGDTLSIEIAADTDTTTQAVVRPDGSITLPHLSADIRAAGRSASALGEAIARAYSAIMRTPQITVAVQASSADLLAKINGTYQVGLDGQLVIPGLGGFAAFGRSPASLSRQIAGVAGKWFGNPVRIALSIAPLTGREVDPRLDADGRAYFRGPVKVSLDGSIALATAGMLPVGGLSLKEVREAIRARVQPSYANPVGVDVTLADSPSLSVFVGGEVRQPGRYAYVKSMTLLQLISTSGWVTDVGDMTRVLLLHPTAPAHYDVYRTNVREVLDHGAIGQDLPVAPQDIIVVPMTYIGEVDQAVDQYIRRVLPFSTAATYSYISNPVGNNTVTNGTSGK